ncbi:THAP domain-containing protein 6 isoform X2 [Nerophis lumbriciformis]|uniref:THAP domain-containing protein 6 isoform X2 n=1 Tax=Nerophis lumbriciformis TaxID=546530 RepID=UPI002ADFD53F|nr:THAP domain-containing protein 6 isoform X2 [Nerophis lumbriciformis]
MPQYCAALGCVNKRTADTKTKRITFHKFPKEKELRRQWEVAARKKGFSATKSSVLCSEHFKPHDIDATGQTVRIREGARPSVFNFQYRLQKHVFTRNTKTSKKAQERLKAESECSGNLQQAKPPSLHLPSVDHCYALPASPADVKTRLTEALDMRGKNLINEDLKEKLHSYSDFPVHLLSKQGSECTKDQREFVLDLHLHGPKTYNYLRKSLHLHLPHPHTLQRWGNCLVSKPDLDSTLEKSEEVEEDMRASN